MTKLKLIFHAINIRVYQRKFCMSLNRLFARLSDAQIIPMPVPSQFQNVGPIVRFDIYQFEEDPTPLHSSPPFRPCRDMLTINLDDVLATPPGLATAFVVDVAGTCSATCSDLIVRPTLPILFRCAGNPRLVSARLA